ncbi:4-phosphoerythronate dehydrogenase [Chitinivibrio alkaliphilus]|uniref:Erythronate-4-phosphate dehydrogenase n=1 Tax=Chitinivibrio alkaliphilus ACht1 TaxID=1313304 RepID=U7D9A1_9BACT|nr:4-phosphoerythronate dehydrogenase [Chitinivibrio alkaliphilus]ERP32161.1 erythronate-4-phosphate dehydrogenase [Chitinivibrio alkaliphilus ACht1]
MKILADKNIPFVKEAFNVFGDVCTVQGEDIVPEALTGVDILLVRSVTEVTADLLAGSSVKFVGTATIGTDHVDVAHLQEAGIGFASAPGSNANSVAEYVISAITSLLPDYAEKKIGIVGVGNVGSAVYKKSAALGMKALLNDPPKARNLSSFSTLQETLSEADVVTVHVPLTYDGDTSTYGMVNDHFLSSLKPGALFINTSRGKTLCAEPLLAHAGRLGGYVLDVWPDEPEISNELLSVTRIATPHIAGYSYDGKCMGTAMISRAAAAFFFQETDWVYEPERASEATREIDYTPEGGVAAVVRAAYNIEEDSGKLHKMTSLTGQERVSYFRSLRRSYPQRYEFSHYRVRGISSDTHDAKKLRLLGFRL